MTYPFNYHTKHIVVIAGSRDLTQTQRDDANEYLHQLFESLDPDKHIIVTGGASGIDMMAHHLAQDYGFEAYEIRAAWYLGKTAGFLRNDFMVHIADSVYIIWNGKSRGTRDTLTRATRAGTLRGTIIV